MAVENFPFDRNLRRKRLKRLSYPALPPHFLFTEIAERMAENIASFNRPFSRILDINGGHPELSALLREKLRPETLIGPSSVDFTEEALPFAQSFDLIASNLTLFDVNDLPGTLLQIRKSLRPDGLFTASLLGGESFAEMRAAFLEAEIELYGGASPRFAPLPAIADCAALLQRAGFTLPVADSEELVLHFESPIEALGHFRQTGSASILHKRPRKFLTRKLLTRFSEIYEEKFGDGENIPVTLSIIYMTGSAPSDKQQQALKPGSAESRLAKALDTIEFKSGDRTKPN